MATVQFNLLPDVKLNLRQAQASRGRVTSISFLVSAISLGILVLMIFSVDILQKKQLSDANGQVAAATANLQAVPNLSRILTVQNQLTTLASLHSQKHASSRLFSYLSQLTPSQANLGQLTLDFSNNTLTMSGTADSQQTVNTFIDTLKFAQYQIGTNGSTVAFSSVVESAFNINTSNVSFTLTVQFDPQLFANNLKDASGNPTSPKLVVKNQTTTRSVADDPSNSLFNGQGAR